MCNNVHVIYFRTLFNVRIFFNFPNLQYYMLKNMYDMKWIHLPVESESPVDY